ncbi:hypothetical protein [Frondihabitans cladoniiphilus]|uniref:Uncharacterized protein n=1 Tax=Frondihabitans cladoniiphilus TaxID=715785 RepID=A0ABP8VL28_9MICO
MTIRAADVNVHLDRPPISGTMLLHDDETNTIVPIVIRPIDRPRGFVVRPPLGDTIRDDFDDYKREAERIMHALLTVTTRETADRDRHVSRFEDTFHIPDPTGDEGWQRVRWRYIRGDADAIELETEALKRSGPDLFLNTDDPSPDGADDIEPNWRLR